MRHATRLLAASVLLAVTALTLATPAFAATVKTTTAFTTSKVTAPFGSGWQLAVSVTISNSFGSAPVQPSDGSVDILLEGMPGEYVTAAEIVPGGVAYFAQPANEPPLAAGTYAVTARFTPAAGSGLSESTTKKAATLTIEALTVVPTVEVISDPAATAVPTVRTSLGGTFVDTTGAPPSGNWHVTAVDESGTTAFDDTVAQPTQGADGAPVGALDIPLSAELKASENYTVTATFQPDELIAGGLEVQDVQPSTFTTRAATAAEIFGAPTGVPFAVLAVFGLLALALAALLVWLVVLWRREGAIQPALAEPQPAIVAPAPTLALPAAPVGPPTLEPEDPYLPALPSHPLTPPPVIPEPTAPPVTPAPPAGESTSWSLSDLGLGDNDDDMPEEK